jgi:hemolysin III
MEPEAYGNRSRATIGPVERRAMGRSEFTQDPMAIPPPKFLSTWGHEIPKTVANHGATMILFDLREPISAWSHGAGMMLAISLNWVFWLRCVQRVDEEGERFEGRRGDLYQRGKTVTLLIFGLSLVVCYGSSALYHAVWLTGGPLNRFRRLDHVGIYLLIAGTYTPGAWSLLRRGWRQGTLATVWGFAGLCAARVWFGGILPTWLSTLIYLALGWGVLICYRELARNHSHRTLLSLPLGGVLYSVGALMNLMNWPVLRPGVFGAHELFHFFVLAGSACHVHFMFRVVVPAREPAGWRGEHGNHVAASGSASLRLGERSWAHLGGTLVRRPHLAKRPRARAGWVSRLLIWATGPPWAVPLVEGAPSQGSPEPVVILNPGEP